MIEECANVQNWMIDLKEGPLDGDTQTDEILLRQKYEEPPTSYFNKSSVSILETILDAPKVQSDLPTDSVEKSDFTFTKSLSQKSVSHGHLEVPP